MCRCPAIIAVCIGCVHMDLMRRGAQAALHTYRPAVLYLAHVHVIGRYPILEQLLDVTEPTIPDSLLELLRSVVGKVAVMARGDTERSVKLFRTSMRGEGDAAKAY